LNVTHFIDVRACHRFDELARIGGKALDITTLSLSKKRIEGKTTFPASRHPRNDSQRSMGNAYADGLKVVRPGTKDFDAALHSAS